MTCQPVKMQATSLFFSIPYQFSAKKAISQEKPPPCQDPHRLAGVPAEHLAAVLLVHADVAVELDGVRHVEALDLPGVAEIEPVVRLLVLEAVDDGLRAPQAPPQLSICDVD